MGDCRQRLTSNNTVDDTEASESCKIENDRYRNEIVAGKCCQWKALQRYLLVTYPKENLA